jgi:hypothetical protein
MVDRCGNAVDGQREAETVLFMVGSPEDASARLVQSVTGGANGSAYIRMQ